MAWDRFTSLCEDGEPMSRSYDDSLPGIGGWGHLERGNTARRLEADATETRWDYARTLLPVELLCGTRGVSRVIWQVPGTSYRPSRDPGI